MKWESLLSDHRMGNYTRDPNKRTADNRSEFEKDYHRIIGSASFRRLQDKTQVFPLDKSDFIRTRLTHSLEVSSFARSLGQNISSWLLEKQEPGFTFKTREAICDILQCAGLIHDIGNPPFGHFGEEAIREWFRLHIPQLKVGEQCLSDILDEQMLQDFYHFEGNAQALRLVTKLHFLVNENGMNLTYALLNTIVKYPVSSVQIDKYSGNIKDKKMGFFLAEQELFHRIQQVTGTEGARHPLTYLLESADDTAYLTADIEDAYKKGCISYETLVRELHKYVDGYPIEVLEKQYDRARERLIPDPALYAVQNWVVRMQGYLIFCATQGFTAHYKTIMQGGYPYDLFYHTPAEQLARALGRIAYDYAFTTSPIYKLEIAAGAVITDLMDKLVPAALHYDTPAGLGMMETKLFSLISENYRQNYHAHSAGKEEKEKIYLRLLLVTDCISGMTDSYAKRLYQELRGIDRSGIDI